MYMCKHAHLYRSASHTGQPPAGQPVSITGQPATPTTDTPCVTVTDTRGFNSSTIDAQRNIYLLKLHTMNMNIIQLIKFCIVYNN